MNKQLLEAIRGRPVEPPPELPKEKPSDYDRSKAIAVKGLWEWTQRRDALIRLERNDQSRLHQLIDAAAADKVLCSNIEDTFDPQSVRDLLKGMHSFVLRHDWAAAFRGAKDFTEGAEFRLPFPFCAFELRLAGRTLICIARESEDDHERKEVLLFLSAGDFWYCLPPHEASPIMNFAGEQIMAVCVALEAEVATHTVVHAPDALNSKRADYGRAELADFHVIDLARRSRPANPAHGSGPSGRHVRLHFRRGHWRHLDTGSTTWVRWCLVGDPDLGFIHKSYAL